MDLLKLYFIDNLDVLIIYIYVYTLTHIVCNNSSRLSSPNELIMLF